MKLKNILALALLLNVSRLMAQNPIVTVGNLNKVTIGTGEVNFTAGTIYGRVKVYSASIIRVQLAQKPLTTDFSYAVVGAPMPAKTTISQTSESITVLTDSVKVIINKKPYQISFYTTDGELINQDEAGLTTSWAGEAVTTYKKMQPEEHFIGLGEKTGNLDRKGEGYTNWNSDVYGYRIDQDPLYTTFPFYIGIHHHLNYGIFLDNTFQSDFNFGASNNRFSSFGARGGEMNYYFIYHKRLTDIITSYTYLTGRMPLPPLWSLGYQQNRYSYYPYSEVMRIAHTLRDKRIPTDGITLDIHYMDTYQLFTWNKKRFPEPLAMNKELNKIGFKTTVIVDPGIKVQKGALAYEDGLQKDVYIKYPDGQPYTGQVWPGWCNFTDFTSVKGRNWWHEQVKFFAQSGVSGIWNDMNEISTWGQKMPDNVLFNYDGNPTTHKQAHNVYGMQMARSSYEGAKMNFPERPFILSRSGYAGLQRYSALWTGDNRAEEDHMLQGVRLMNSLGLTGVSFSAMDIGGFTGNPTTSLYTKWMELGAFIPYFRNHTGDNTKAAEPWTFGENVEDVVRNYISLRYQLLPYLYSTFYESTQNGLPVMRSLAINYTFDPNILSTTFQNQYEFGNGLMVAAFESTREYGKIYFPEGEWYDLYSGAKLAGKEQRVVALNVNKLAVYVKGGSIIPMQSLVQTTVEQPKDTLVVHLYNGSKANQFVYYEDDGKSYAYQKGAFYKRSIRFNPDQRTLTFNPAEGDYATHFKNIKLMLHGFDQLDKVKVAGKSVGLIAGSYAYLGASPGTDPQISEIAAESCPVKYTTFGNSRGAIQITYSYEKE